MTEGPVGCSSLDEEAEVWSCMQITKWKVGDAIRIGPNIWIKIVEARGKQVRLGIMAPSELLIFRDELVVEEKT